MTQQEKILEVCRDVGDGGASISEFMARTGLDGSKIRDAIGGLRTKMHKIVKMRHGSKRWRSATQS